MKDVKIGENEFGCLEVEEIPTRGIAKYIEDVCGNLAIDTLALVWKTSS